MKKIFNSFVVVAMMAAAATTSSCTKTCDAGYEGSDCKTEVRAKIIGTYKVTETCGTTGSAVYNVTISKSSSDVLKVLIVPFGGYPAITGTAKVDGTNVTVEAQTSGNYTFNGTGTIGSDGASISMSYTMTVAGVGSETCTGTWAKQ